MVLLLLLVVLVGLALVFGLRQAPVSGVEGSPTATAQPWSAVIATQVGTGGESGGGECNEYTGSGFLSHASANRDANGGSHVYSHRNNYSSDTCRAYLNAAPDQYLGCALFPDRGGGAALCQRGRSQGGVPYQRAQRLYRVHTGFERIPSAGRWTSGGGVTVFHPAGERT